ncbi:hypothetical protein J6590_037889 [Homalodisca vitripennis]|nr:hypothetical protein J6590_037889 [Homalodisca vitripennis]
MRNLNLELASENGIQQSQQFLNRSFRDIARLMQLSPYTSVILQVDICRFLISSKPTNHSGVIVIKKSDVCKSIIGIPKPILLKDTNGLIGYGRSNVESSPDQGPSHPVMPTEKPISKISSLTNRVYSIQDGQHEEANHTFFFADGGKRKNGTLGCRRLTLHGHYCSENVLSTRRPDTVRPFVGLIGHPFEVMRKAISRGGLALFFYASATSGIS